MILATVATAALWFGWNRYGPHAPPLLLLAPMINVFDQFNDLAEPPTGIGNCNRPGGLAATLIENTLSGLGSRVSPNGRVELSYILQFPLFCLLKEEGGQWVVDRPAVTHPEFGTADVGWRFDLNSSALARGSHRLDAILEDQPDRWVHLGTRCVSVMERNQVTPIALPGKNLPPTAAPDASLRWSVDLPVDQSS